MKMNSPQLQILFTDAVSRNSEESIEHNFASTQPIVSHMDARSVRDTMEVWTGCKLVAAWTARLDNLTTCAALHLTISS